MEPTVTNTVSKMMVSSDKRSVALVSVKISSFLHEETESTITVTNRAYLSVDFTGVKYKQPYKRAERNNITLEILLDAGNTIPSSSSATQKNIYFYHAQKT